MRLDAGRDCGNNHASGEAPHGRDVWETEALTHRAESPLKVFEGGRGGNFFQKVFPWPPEAHSAG
ncbi:hypothetical protein, partial [Solidesulfovibrio sp. C21]|uniref:hypothetical protein n=1 Tax=Solidesulfovibrio sp. C21 TaxID=3398613 RepID=UPI0039FC9BB0